MNNKLFAQLVLIFGITSSLVDAIKDKLAGVPAVAPTGWRGVGQVMLSAGMLLVIIWLAGGMTEVFSKKAWKEAAGDVES